MPRLVDLLRALARQGVEPTVGRLRQGLGRRFRGYLDSSFDRRHGVDTAGTAELDTLGITSGNVGQGIWYEPIPERVFRTLISQITMDHTRFLFVDLGSGKGRALLLASSYPFQRIVGVEFSEVLHLAALENLSRFRSTRQRCTRLESICLDATAYPWPNMPTLVFLYSPFKAPVLRVVLDNLLTSLESAPRPVFVLFYGTNPESLEMLRGLPGFQARELRVPRDYTREVTRTGLLSANRSLTLP